jgi:pseudaminic acid cytidylyltransferase
MRVAIIPARGGSKRIPRKNIRPFLGRPIIAYSIDAAHRSGLFDKVVVSTDDVEISEIARSCGADVPFFRPDELSDDQTPTIPVVRHAIDWLDQNVGRVATACCIYATCPFVRPETLVRGYDVLVDQGTEFAFPVTTFPFPIFRALKIANGRTEMFWPEHELTRSQDLVESYHDAGQFYWGTAAAYRQNSGIFSANSAPVTIPRYLVQDIDTLEDWTRAEHMFRALFGRVDEDVEPDQADNAAAGELDTNNLCGTSEE